ncbi:hypothetical protein PCL_10964 [Purpureocillium lilacinum]|uniref:Uncharacterized protein n=1 Tax=Purpureocillium lilacinum TaxID=33203 RepID=A0A2U3ECU2_PURLI|nr:hypothetical protein PCL_10964 [Purpureocillium lilacinum]
MLRDWGPGSVQEKIVASGAKGSPCAGVQSARGGGEAARRPAEGRMTEFFGFFSPECHLTVCFSPECHLTAWPQFLSAARPRAAAAFYFSQSDSQDKLPTPARPTRGRRCVMPGRAGPAGGEGEGEGVPSSASGCAGVAASRGGGEALEDGGGGQGGGHGDPPSRRSREEGGESPSLVEWAVHGSSSSSSRVDNDAAVHVRLPGQLLRRRLPPHGRPASRCGQEPQGASPSRPPTCSGVLAPLRGRIQGPTGAAGIDAPQTPGTETGSRLGGSVQRRRTGTTAQHSGTPHFASETHCTPVGCVSPRDTLTTAKPVSVGIARILSPAPERVLHRPGAAHEQPAGAMDPVRPDPIVGASGINFRGSQRREGPPPPPCPAAIDAPPPALSRLSETWNPIVVIASSPGGGHASLPKAGATHQHAPAKPQAACRTGFPSGSC